MDFWVAGRLVVEAKAVDRLAPIHKAQAISYLKATGHPLGLLMNFNEVLLSDGLQGIILSGWAVRRLGGWKFGTTRRQNLCPLGV